VTPTPKAPSPERESIYPFWHPHLNLRHQPYHPGPGRHARAPAFFAGAVGLLLIVRHFAERYAATLGSLYFVSVVCRWPADCIVL
jgi:hypothetical protein